MMAQPRQLESVYPVQFHAAHLCRTAHAIPAAVIPAIPTVCLHVVVGVVVGAVAVVGTVAAGVAVGNPTPN